MNVPANTVELRDVRGRGLQLAGLGLLAAGAVWNLLPAHPPFACPLLTATGIPCPFCGMTRAVVAAMHGDVLGSLAFNPAGLLVIALAIFVIARARLPVTRIPIGIVIAFFAALWVWNVAFNRTF